MKRATIEIDEELDEALAAYGRDRGVADDLETVVQAALREMLEEHGFLIPFRPFRMTPIEYDGDDDGPTDISINHDKYFADWETGGSR